jgi:rod shape determining protein RodA
MFSKYFNFLKQFDWILLVSVFLLVCFSLAALGSIALSKESPDFSFFGKQLIYTAVGFFLLIVLSFLDYRLFKNYALIFYAVVLILLVGVLIFGKTVRGTTGWYSFGSFNFQPVELAKLGLIVFLSRFLSMRAREMDKLKHLFTCGAVSSLPIFLVLLQPDFGSALILFFLWFGMLFLIGVKKSHLLIILLIISLLLVGAWFFAFKDYQKARIISFLNPSSDPLGRGYNILQSKIAVGAGGLFGRGLGFGSQSQLKFIPESQTDFIFAVIAEELGFVGIFLVLGIFGIFFWRAIKIAKKVRDDFASFLILGISVLFLIQIFINVGMNIGLVPVAGIGLPFLSYGGSSLVVNLAMVGIIESIAART